MAGTDLGGVLDDPSTWTFVPEPSTGLLFGLGLVGIALKRRSAVGASGLGDAARQDIENFRA